MLSRVSKFGLAFYRLQLQASSKGVWWRIQQYLFVNYTLAFAFFSLFDGVGGKRQLHRMGLEENISEKNAIQEIAP